MEIPETQINTFLNLRVIPKSGNSTKKALIKNSIFFSAYLPFSFELTVEEAESKCFITQLMYSK